MVVILTHSSLCPLCPCVCLDQSGSLSSRQVSGVVACYPQARLKGLLPKASLAPLTPNLSASLLCIYRSVKETGDISEGPWQLNLREIRWGGRWAYVCI